MKITPHTVAEELGLEYYGDLNPEYGGLFFDPDPRSWYRHDYVDAVKLTEHGPLVLIDHGTIYRQPDKQLQRALAVIGEGHQKKAPLVTEVLAFDAYSGVQDSSLTVITTDPEQWEYDGLKAEKHITPEDLLGYLRAEHLVDIKPKPTPPTMIDRSRSKTQFVIVDASRLLQDLPYSHNPEAELFFPLDPELPEDNIDRYWLHAEPLYPDRGYKYNSHELWEPLPDKERAALLWLRSMLPEGTPIEIVDK